MKIGVSITPCAVCNRPRRARVFGSLVSSSNFIGNSLDEVTSRDSPIRDLPERRLFNLASIDSYGTSGVESTSRRRINGSRHIAAQNDPLFFRGWIRYRHGLQQCL